MKAFVAGLLGTAMLTMAAQTAGNAAPLTGAEVLAAGKPSDWRALNPADTLDMQLPQGRVVIELAPEFAPRHVANVKALVRARYFDGLAVERVQDDYVVQWGDADGKRPLPRLPKSLPAEYDRPLHGLRFTRLAGVDSYAPETGFVDGMPAAADPASDRAWPVHCYGMVGVGRDNPPDTGNGGELYAVIGQAPRHLDRNIALIGRVVEGMRFLSSLPRGHGPLGFYRNPAHRVPVRSIRLESELPPKQRSRLQVLRTDTATFSAYVTARRNRSESWFVRSAGAADVCNVPIPVRPTPR